MVVFKISCKETSPIDDQKPGTSGLRKKVKVLTQPNYLHNFVQLTFIALTAEKVRGATLVLSSDGHYFSKEAMQIIIKTAAGNGVRCIWVGQNGLLSTPAVSAVIHERVGTDGSKATGAFILTASHNPGSPHEDLGSNITWKMVDQLQRELPTRSMRTQKQLRSTLLLKTCLIYFFFYFLFLSSDLLFGL